MPDTVLCIFPKIIHLILIRFFKVRVVIITTFIGEKTE